MRQHGRASKRSHRGCGTLISTFALSLVAACGATTPAQIPPLSGPLIVKGGQSAGLHGTVVSDPALVLPQGTFVDTRGHLVTFASQPTTGITVLFFGFTHCVDVCPTTMADLAGAKRRLPPGAARQVRVVFVTVDPSRDSPVVLQHWLAGFDATFIGLRAPQSVVRAAERSLYAPVSDIAKPGRHASTDYQVSHTGSVYVFGQGDRSVLYTGGTTASEYATDFQRLLRDR